MPSQLKQFGFNLPADLKFNSRETKIILRRLAERLLPEEIARKPKWGFGIPIDLWINDEAKKEIKHILLHNKKANPLALYYDFEVYSKWVEAFCENRQYKDVSREGLYQRVIMLLSLHYYLSEA